MSSDSVRRRTGVALSPVLIIALIVVGLLIVEGLLIARFWLQMIAANASSGINALVLDASRPLVAPFADETRGVKEVGWFDRRTLIAALVYLGGGVGLAIATAAFATVFSAARQVMRPRRSLSHTNRLRPERAHGRLVDMLPLKMRPSQASRALSMLNLERLDADLHVIPTAEGCIVAAFERERAASYLPVVGRLRSTRDAIAVKRTFRAIEQRLAPQQLPPQRREARSRIPAGAHR